MTHNNVYPSFRDTVGAIYDVMPPFAATAFITSVALVLRAVYWIFFTNGPAINMFSSSAVWSSVLYLGIVCWFLIGMAGDSIGKREKERMIKRMSLTYSRKYQ